MKGAYMANGVIVLNLCCDVMYIIEQRLKAQSIDREKSAIVLNDLAQQIFSSNFLNKIFKPSKTFNNDFIFKLIDQIVHSSIMKLNSDSLSKLYDLILMTLKSYIMKSNSPFEIYLCTLKHFDVISQIGINDSAKQALFTCQKQFIDMYSKLNSFDYLMIRCEIMRFLQNKFIRVQMFLNDKSQNQDGTFSQKLTGIAGFGIEKPGLIQVMKIKEQYNVVLMVSQTYKENPSINPFKGNTVLGENIFSNRDPQPPTTSQVSKIDSQMQTKQLNHLASLIKPVNQQDEINFFYKPNIIKNQDGKEILITDAQKQSHQMKEQILKLFDDQQLKEEEEDVDLLDLMDQAAQ